MSVTLTPRVLQADEVLDHLRALRSRQPVRYWAFYSSQLGGIVTDPALMVIPFTDVPVAAARAAREMLLIGSSIKVPIVEWDGKPIGDGKPGPVARALFDVLAQDMRSARDRLLDVPY